MRNVNVHRRGAGGLVSRSVAALVMSAAAAAGVLVLGAQSASAATAANGNTPVSPTGTKAISLEGASLLGAVPASTPLTVSVVLNVPNATALTTRATEVSTPGSADYGQFLTPSEVASEYSPTDATASAVAAWLQSAGLSAVSVEPDRLFVDATGDAATIEKTFGTALSLYSYAGQDVYENTSAALVPARFAGEVAAVLGLSDMPMTLPHVVRQGAPSLTSLDTQQITATTAPDTAGFTPQQLATIYSAASLPKASRTSVAVVVSGDMTSTIADLRYAEAQNHAAQAPVSVVYTAPEADVVTDNPNTGNLEWDLDTQMSTQIAGNVSHEYLYDITTLDDADVARAINMFVEQDKAVAGSASLGECDVQPFLEGSMVATDEVLEEGALQGQSFFASSGDNGYACPEIASTGVPGGVPGTSWPASGTWTTGVGGTSLLATSAGAYMDELSWIGGGGGISNFETAGPWTSVANPASTAGAYVPTGGRGVPDIAADADPNVSPVIVWQDGASNLVGGTSVASPLTMGIWARLQTAHSNDLGVASVDFYGLYNASNATGKVPTDPAGFHDITLGTNGLYTALPGYDFTTGIGSFDASVLNTELAKG